MLVLHMVRAMGFDQAQLTSGPSDRGVDVIAYQPATTPGIVPRTREWIFQCKRTSRITKREIEEELANFASKKIDTWMLVTTMKPSPEFRRWFDKLETNLKYGFHIQAWWRDDLENLLITYADHLPVGILNQLNLQVQHQATTVDTLAAAQARLRLFADSQIDRFARGKYIPKLYVHRRLQNDVIQFSSSEPSISNLTKTDSISVVEESIHLLETYLKSYDERTFEIRVRIGSHDSEIAEKNKQIKEVSSEIRSLQKVGPRAEQRLLGRKSYLNALRESHQNLLKKRRLLQDEVKLRSEKKDLAQSLVKDLATNLENSLSVARQLPSQDYFRAGSQYEVFSSTLSSVTELIDSNLKEVPLSDRQEEPLREQYQAWEPEIEMLLEGGFLQEFRERLRLGIENADRLFRNCLVIIDRAGSGKTNMICHLVKSLVNDEAVILLFGKEQFQGSDAIIKSITEAISKALGNSSDPMTNFDRLLEKEGKFLFVFVDGINENRRIAELDLALGTCLAWARAHRIKFILTCRDIYWEFFNYESWGHNVQRLLREELNQFSSREYLSALPLYFEHYRIKCELADEAREACHHPLLLRFFCEAYGSVDGPPVNLGQVRDIRLKELFDIYLSRKADQIRKALAHRNSDLVLRYLLNLVAFMFTKVTTVLKTSDIENATGDPNTSTEDSLYLRLLDEDIIIEEQPGDDINSRRISFVYEEFMEYLLARSIVKEPKRLGIESVENIFSRLNGVLSDWVNARGVGEYVALMLMDEPSTRTKAFHLLNLMVAQGKTWLDAFWSVVGKCPESQLGTPIYDLFFSAVDKSSLSVIKRTLMATARYSQEGAHTLSSILLWSVALPKALSWTDLEALDTMSHNELVALADRLSSRIKRQEFLAPAGTIGFDSLLNTLLPFVHPDKRKNVRDLAKKYGEPFDRYSSRAFVRVFWRAFPEYQPMLVNGLFSDTDWTRSYCADRLKFIKRSRPQVGYLCHRLATVENDPHVKTLLKDCADRLMPASA